MKSRGLTRRHACSSTPPPVSTGTRARAPRRHRPLIPQPPPTTWRLGWSRGVTWSGLETSQRQTCPVSERPVQRRISVALIATVLVLVAFAPTTFAECMTWPLQATEHPRVAYAFVATVTGVEQHEMHEKGSGHYRYEVTLRTEQTYRGSVPDRLELTGTYAGCSFVRVEALTKGETVFVASERVQTPCSEWETWFGDALVWRQVRLDMGVRRGRSRLRVGREVLLACRPDSHHDCLHPSDRVCGSAARHRNSI